MVESTEFTLEEIVDFGTSRIIYFDEDHDAIKSVVEEIYFKSGSIVPDISPILKSISTRTFTKKGNYYISLLGDTKTREVFLFVCKDEIKRTSSIKVSLKGLSYKPKWFGILGYSVVASN